MPNRPISIHALLAESDRRGVLCYLDNIISIHALLAESDGFSRPLRAAEHKFLSTLSLRRATMFARILPHDGRISIHALLAESDVNKITYQRQINQFLSTLSLRRATELVHKRCKFNRFLSTLSLRRATMIHPLLCNARPNFYPRSPCGERQKR